MEDQLVQKSPQEIPSLSSIILEERTRIPGVVQAKLMNSLWQGTPETVIERFSRVATDQAVRATLSYCELANGLLLLTSIRGSPHPVCMAVE